METESTVTTQIVNSDNVLEDVCGAGTDPSDSEFQVDDPGMETVSLEMDDEQNQEETTLTLDTVKFEIEDEVLKDAETCKNTGSGSAPRPIQSFFDETDFTKEFDSDVGHSSFFDTVSSKPSEEELRSSTLLESFYEGIEQDPIRKSPEVVSSVFDPIGNEASVSESDLEGIGSKDLSKFFADEKHGSDTIGKAFFDSLADSILDKDQSIVDNLLFDPSSRSEDDRDGVSYSAWISKNTTKQVLDTMASTPPGTYVLEKENLTMPGVIMTEELKDPIRDLARQYLGVESSAQRVTLTADNVSQDEEGLTKLINVGCFRAAVNLTTRILTKHGQGLKRSGHQSLNSPQSLQIWLVRLSLLLKLRLFNMAEAESEPFGDLDRPDLCYEFYPELYGSRHGSMVPFGLRILSTQILTCVGKFGEATDRLYVILNTVTKIIENLEKGQTENGNLDSRSQTIRRASLDLWKKREVKVLYTITNCLIAQNDFYSAYSLLDTVLEKMPLNKANIRSAQGHILLQLGDIKLAQTSFALAANARGESDKEKVATLLDKALMCISHNVFEDAYNFLKEAQALDENNPTVINNMAVCLLYMGKLQDSFRLLEGAIAKNPKTFLHECVLVNICTLYDLESSRSLQKKSGMLEVVCRNAGDGFNVFCLKLQNIA